MVHAGVHREAKGLPLRGQHVCCLEGFLQPGPVGQNGNGSPFTNHPSLADFERRVDNVVTGAGLAFKRNQELLEKDIPQIPGLLHDGWIGLYFAAKNTLKANPEKLFQYRSHANQQVGGKIAERSQLLDFNLAKYSCFKRNSSFSNPC